MPDSSAAVGLPPIAAEYLPRTVLSWTMISTTITSSATKNAAGSPSRTSWRA